jgi:imidazoleglycerol-phosphate dehydratase
VSELTRETGETRVRVALDDDSDFEIATGDDFLDHMLITLARYSGWGLVVDAVGDLRHHLIEDVAITLGQVAARDTPATCVRYADAVVPMDEALVQVALDAGGRPHYEGELPSPLYDHFFRSFAMNADWTVHVRVLRGTDRHHVVEAAFKALGMAIRQALQDDGTVFSTKGSVRTEWSGGLDEAPELGDPPPSPAGRPGRGGQAAHTAHGGEDDVREADHAG